MEPVRKNIGVIMFALLAVVLVVAVIHLAGHVTSTPDQIGGGTTSYDPWTPTPAAVVSTTAAATSSPAAGEPEDGGGGGDSGDG
jgi:hypothetical protein